MSELVGFATHREVLSHRFEQYQNGLKDGTIIPVLYPLFTYGTGVLALFLLVPPSAVFHSPSSRYMTFLIVCLINAWVIHNCKSYGPASGIGVGIITAWGTIWAATLLVFKDAKSDFKRLEQRIQNTPTGKDEQNHDGHSEPDLRKRTKSSIRKDISTSSDQAPKVSYIWQSYPVSPFRHRFNWTMDLVGSFRGIGWDWHVPGLPSFPKEIQEQLQTRTGSNEGLKDIPISPSGLKRFDSLSPLTRHALWTFASSYLVIDVIKLIIIHDPYFWGQIDSPAPSWLPGLIQNSSVLTRCYRLFVSQCGVWMVLRMIYSLAPLGFAGVLGPRILGAYGEPWLYPDIWGNYSNVLDRGLIGWWGGWWHQMFRKGFMAAGLWVTSAFGVEEKSQVSQVIQLFVAFIMSGYIHASGSSTAIGATNPPQIFLFFLLQAMGASTEMFLQQKLKQWGISSRVPRPIGQATRFLYTHIWFYYTGPLLADDFAKSGVWLCDPVPLSPLRALGFGVEGDGFLCWKGNFGHWYNGSNMLLTGFAL